MDSDKWINKIHQGDVLEVLKEMPDELIDMAITSPPYWSLRDYNVDGQIGLEEHPQIYIDKLVEVFHELKRILKPTGSFFLNCGDTFFGGNLCCGMPEGYESISTSNKDQKFDTNRFNEFIKKRNKLRSNWLQPKQLLMVPYRLAAKMQDDGWILRNIICWEKSNPMPSCLHPDTEIYLLNNNEIEISTLEKLIKEGIKNRKILTPTGWKKIKNIWKIEKEKYISFKFGSSGIVISSLNHKFPISHSNRRKQYEIKESINIREEKTKSLDRFLFFPISKYIDNINNTSNINGFELDYELGKFIGLIVAEGGFNVKYPQGKITVNKSEDKIIEFFKNILKERFGIIKFSHRIKNNYQSLQFYSYSVMNLYKTICNGKCVYKSLNMNLILNTSLEFRKGLFDGIILGDGHIDKNNRIVIGLASKELRNNIYLLCSSIDLLSSIHNHSRYDKRTEKTYYSYFLSIPKTLQKEYKKGELVKHHYYDMNKKNLIKSIYKNEFFAKTLKISNIKIIEKKIELIDIEVEDNLFIINGGLITHNSVKDRFNTSYEPIFFFVKSKKYYFDMDSVREPYKTSSIQRYDYPLGHIRTNAAGLKEITGYHCDKDVSLNPLGKIPNDFIKYDESKFSSKEEESKHRQGFSKDRNEFEHHPLGKTPTDIFPVNTTSFKGSHFAVFPPELLMKPIKASCPQQVCKKCGVPRERIIKNPEFDYSVDTENIKDTHKRNINDGKMQSTAALHRTGNEGVFYMGKTVGWTKCNCNAGFEPGIVLDPFFGSGTTGVVAKELNRRWIGIELNPEYIKMAKKRVGKYTVVHDFDGKTDQPSEELVDEDGLDWSI